MSGTIAIVDYRTGNCGSIRNMLRKVGQVGTITADHREILGASRIILPGVGAFDQGMTHLRQSGLIPVLQEAVWERRIPLLGICLGMQLLSGGSEEGVLDGLGWIPGRTIRFRPERADPGVRLPIPHMGWNELQIVRSHPLLRELPELPRFYFVHAYHVQCDRDEDSLATAKHGYPFTAVVGHGLVAGVQFHPEKSHRYGIQIFRSFVREDYGVELARDSVPAVAGRRAG